MNRASALLVAALALTACSEALDPRSRLTDARVLAVLADPLEAGPDDTVTLRPFAWIPAGDSVASQRWTFCPFTLGASSGYACALAACEVALPVGAGGETRGAPLELARPCLDAAMQAGAARPEGIPAALPPRVDVAFKYRLTTAAGTVRDAVALIPVYTGAIPQPRNLPPRIERVEIGGVAATPGAVAPPLASGGELELRVVLAADSAQPFTDDLGAAAREELVVSFFTTAGKLDADRADGPDARQTLKGEDLGDAAEAEIWMVASDLRGGQAVTGPYRVPIAR